MAVPFFLTGFGKTDFPFQNEEAPRTEPPDSRGNPDRLKHLRPAAMKREADILLFIIRIYREKTSAELEKGTEGAHFLCEVCQIL